MGHFWLYTLVQGSALHDMIRSSCREGEFCYILVLTFVCMKSLQIPALLHYQHFAKLNFLCRKMYFNIRLPLKFHCQHLIGLLRSLQKFMIFFFFFNKPIISLERECNRTACSKTAHKKIARHPNSTASKQKVKTA